MLRLVIVCLAAAMAYGATVPPSPGSPPANTDAGAPGDTTTPASASSTPAAGRPTPPVEIPCNPSLLQIQAVFAYTTTPDFKELSENQQILVYELLAAGEACKLTEFITPATTLRLLLLLEDMPLRYTYLFVGFLSRALQDEGVVVPV